MSEEHPKNDMKIINEAIKNLPSDVSPEFLCNLIANIIVSYGLFDEIAEIQVGTIFCASKIIEEMQDCKRVIH